MLFATRHKKRQPPEFELWVFSLILKSFTVGDFWKTQVGTERLVWDLFVVEFVFFFIVMGSGLGY